MVALVERAPGVWQLPLVRADAVNAYLIDDVLVDTGPPWTRAALLAALADRRLAAHVLTHAHPDHQGASAAVCTARGVPLWCGVGDRDAAERGDFSLAWAGRRRRRVFRAAARLGGPGHPVARALREGDVVAGFVVVETPGHTPGHLALWRASDGVLVLGDAASHRNPLALSRGLREPTWLYTRDPEANRRSLRKVAALGPRLVCFGHGPPLADGARFVRWVAGL